MFSQPKKIFDRWIGTESVNLHGGKIDTISYTFRAGSKELSQNQKEEAIAIFDRYSDLWKIIEPKLSERFSLNTMSHRVLFYMPAVVGGDKYEYMLGYEFVSHGIVKNAFFAFNQYKLEYTHIDAH